MFVFQLEEQINLLTTDYHIRFVITGVLETCALLEVPLSLYFTLCSQLWQQESLLCAMWESGSLYRYLSGSLYR